MPSNRHLISLNGLWDFMPVLSEEGKRHLPPSAIPESGWLKKGIMVPGSWTRGGCAGSTADSKEKPWEQWRIFDSYGYPPEWDSTCTAWYRTKFIIGDIDNKSRYILRFGGILRQSWIFINGREAGTTRDGIMPSTHDITHLIMRGENELVVYVTDYERNDKGKTFIPTGADQMQKQKGIWQDVCLSIVPEIRISDITIRTSVRKREIRVFLDIENNSSITRVVESLLCVMDNRLPAISFSIPKEKFQPGEARRIEAVAKWNSYTPWSHITPKLYKLVVRLSENGRILDENSQRFGFREVWTEKHNIILNGRPVHLFGEWCHKHSFDNFRPEYIRQWYRMLKDCNMNYIRTHTYPHPEILLDLADEMGILVSLESGWHFGTTFALEESRFWEGAKQHIRNIIQRDKNHPSVILYSVGNEVRWSGNVPAIIKGVPGLRKLYEELDPTRIPYHDGDSSLWDERAQHLISRHYGLECTGEAWWDKSKPLHVGEVGKWHFGQPIDTCVRGDDRVFASFRECHKSVALETADMAEQARANEVACFFPWNLSGLDNYRPWAKEKKFKWDDLSAPHLKPFRSAPYGSEFAWWEPDSKGYSPGVSFDIMRDSFRPFAIVIRERLNRVFDDVPVLHTVTLVNDTGGSVEGTISVKFFSRKKIYCIKSQKIIISCGDTKKLSFNLYPFKVKETTDAVIKTEFFDSAKSYDIRERSLKIIPSSEKTEKWEISGLTVFGKGSMECVLNEHKVEYSRIDDIKTLDPANAPILLIEKDSIIAGSRQNKLLRQFVEKGGRVLIMEQSASALPMLMIDAAPSEYCYIRGGKDDILEGFTDEDFKYWGNDPYGTQDSDSWVVVNPYRKPAGGISRGLVHSGFGDFGKGGFYWSPLLETRAGKGIALACQMRLSGKAGSHPSATRLLKRLLYYAQSWKPEARRDVFCFTDNLKESISRIGVKTTSDIHDSIIMVRGGYLSQKEIADIEKLVRRGSTAIIISLTNPDIRIISEIFNMEIKSADLGTHYHFVRETDDKLLDGISNQETYWLDNMSYVPAGSENHPMTDVSIICKKASYLLKSESESCWREFFTLGGRAEDLRMPLATYYLWDGPRKNAGGLLKIPHGKGTLLLCQVPLPETAYEKAEIFWTHLMSNTGADFIKTLFDGDSVAPGSKKSEGSPPSLYYTVNSGEKIFKRMLDDGTPKDIHLPNMAIDNAFEWKTLNSQNGKFSLPEAPEELIIMMQVRPGRPRKTRYEGNLPDPSEQTLLDLFGSGETNVYVNRQNYGKLELGKAGQANFSDIELEKEWNTVLIKWKNPGSSIGLLWRNRQGQPEHEFEFHKLRAA